MLPSQPNRSLIDGLACLQAVASQGRAVGSRELGRLLDMEPTRANRLLKTLAHLGIVKQSQDRKYEPGPGLHVLAAQALYGSRLLQRSIPTLEALHDTGLAVAMGVLWRGRVCYLYHADPGMAVGVALGRSALYPAQDSGIGLALLALMPEQSALEQLPDQATTEARQALRQARRDGYAVTPTRPNGYRSIGVAIGEEAVGIALAGPIPDTRIEPLTQRLRQAVSQIQKEATR